MAKRDLQARRDQLDVGCEVLVRRSGSERQYHGVIKNMYSTMAAVQLDKSHKVEMIALTKLLRVEPTNDAPSATPPPPAPPKLAVVEAPKSLPPPTDDVTAWLEMGKGLATTIEAQIAELQQEANGLRATAVELSVLADDADQRRGELELKLQTIRSIAGGP